MLVFKMAFGLSKLILSIGAFGFILGSVAYLVFNWFITSNMIVVTSLPIASVLFAPWFISGIAGCLLSIVIVYMFARFSSDS